MAEPAIEALKDQTVWHIVRAENRYLAGLSATGLNRPRERKNQHCAESASGAPARTPSVHSGNRSFERALYTRKRGEARAMPLSSRSRVR